MTRQQAKDIVRALGPGFMLRWYPQLKEWALYTPGCNGSAYYTDDTDDAVNTARHIAENKGKGI